MLVENSQLNSALLSISITKFSDLECVSDCFVVLVKILHKNNDIVFCFRIINITFPCGNIKISQQMLTIFKILLLSLIRFLRKPVLYSIVLLRKSVQDRGKCKAQQQVRSLCDALS